MHCELNLHILYVICWICELDVNKIPRATSTLPEFMPIIDKLLRGLTIGLAMQQYPVLRTVGEILRNLSPFEGTFRRLVESKIETREKRLDTGQDGDIQD